MTSPRSRQERPEEALVGEAAGGDAEALGVLYDLRRDDVARFVARMLGADHPEVDDIVQLTFITAWRRAASFRGDASARVWLLGIARNLVLQAVRRRSRADAAKARLQLLPGQDEGAPGAERRAMLAAVERAIQQLSALQREAFVLCDVQGLSTREAATVAEVPMGTLGRRLYDARRSLRALLREETAA